MIDPILELFFSFLGGANFLPGLLSFGVVGAVVLTIARRFHPPRYDA